MPGQICLITGATDGVGKATAAKLADRGFHIILAARDLAKAEAVKAQITEGNGSQVDILPVDLSSLKSVENLAATINKQYPRLDVLINNAGTFTSGRKLTADGFESTYQVNYLSAFLLTQRLLGKLVKSTQGRIINLSSSVYTIGKFDENNLQSERSYSILGSYSASKLFMLLYSIELAGRLRDTRITVNAVHPGIVRTKMMLRAPGMYRFISWLALPVSISPTRGAVDSVRLAASSDVERVTGRYFAGGKAQIVKSKFNDSHTRLRLWEVSSRGLQEHGFPDSGSIPLPVRA